MTHPSPPGSPAAVEAGCLCPVYDNHHGEGRPAGGFQALFWITLDCPLHGRAIPQPEMESDDA